jgi:hypothetical protein
MTTGIRQLALVLTEPAAIAAQQIEQQQIRDSGAVGNTPALDPGHAFAAEFLPEFGEKPRLADAGLADEVDGSPVAVFDLSQDIVQDRQVALAVDEIVLRAAVDGRRAARACDTSSRR